MKVGRISSNLVNQAIFIPEKPTQKPGQWTLSTFYKRAFDVSLKFKTLWIVGLALSLSLGGCNYFQGFNLPQGRKEQNFLKELQNSDQVLGTTTESLSGFLELFKAIPTEVYLLIATEFIILIILWFAVSYLGRAWSTAGLIIGIDAALKDSKLTLSQISDNALPKVKKLLWLAIVPTLILMAATAIIIISSILLIALKIQVLGIMILIIGLLAIITAFITLNLSLIYAQRSASLENISAKDSLKRGFSFLRKKYWWTLLVGIINNVFGTILSLAIAGIFIGLILGGIFNLDNSKPLGIVLLVVGGLLAFIGIFGAFSLVGSILTVFKATVWNQAYEETKKIIDAA